MYLKRDEVYYVHYDDKSDLDYQVALKENQYYDKTYVEKNNQYIASLIDYIDAYFRYDLNVNGVGRPLCYGAIDVKFVSAKEIMEGKNIVHIISGPTNDQQPTFSWLNTTCHVGNPTRWYHEDVVDIWDFPWIDYEVQLFDE